MLHLAVHKVECKGIHSSFQYSGRHGVKSSGTSVQALRQGDRDSNAAHTWNRCTWLTGLLAAVFGAVRINATFQWMHSSALLVESKLTDRLHRASHFDLTKEKTIPTRNKVNKLNHIHTRPNLHFVTKFLLDSPSTYSTVVVSIFEFRYQQTLTGDQIKKQLITI